MTARHFVSPCVLFTDAERGDYEVRADLNRCQTADTLTDPHVVRSCV